MIYVIGPKDKVAPTSQIINTTSGSNIWSGSLSPFYVGPVDLYRGMIARNVENAWQFAKVYKSHVDSHDNPTSSYYAWAKKGWNDSYAHRYPMGKGAVPLYSLWDGEKLDYIAARKQIYIPLYAKAVQKTHAFEKLKQIYQTDGDLYLWDWDGYDFRKLNYSYDQVINDPTRKMGHAFVLAMLLEGYL